MLALHLLLTMRSHSWRSRNFPHGRRMACTAPMGDARTCQNHTAIPPQNHGTMSGIRWNKQCLRPRKTSSKEGTVVASHAVNIRTEVLDWNPPRTGKLPHVKLHFVLMLSTSCEKKNTAILIRTCSENIGPTRPFLFILPYVF